jgi:uncharacterized membrane protein YhdT
MTEPARPPTTPTLRGLVGIPSTGRIALFVTGLLVANVIFFLLSWVYSDLPLFEPPPAITHARWMFLVTSSAVAAAGFLSSIAPRRIGHALAMIMGSASLVAAFEAFFHDMTPVISVTLLVVGLLVPALAWLSWMKSRVGWSFLCSVVGVFAGVTFFGAPKVRNVLDISLWTAMALPGLMVVTVIALAMVRADYQLAGHERAAAK